MKNLLAVPLVAGVLLLGATTPVGAAASAHHLPMGIVPHAGAAPVATPRLSSSALGTGPLFFHGGPVMRTNTVYAIYWMPAGSTCDATAGYTCAQYRSAINRYFTDVATASGSASNVYSVATQYYDTSGAIAYNSTFGGSYVDTTAFPLVSQCNDTTTFGGDPVCVSDAQLQTEIQAAIAANGWPIDTTSTGPRHLYFIFTPSNVGICNLPGSAGNPNQCSTNAFCAYHDYFGSGVSGEIAYAVEPDNATIPTGGCTTGSADVGYGADDTINTISHEHNEAITDPWPDSGWLDSSGYENGDKCAWYYMSNQTINGDAYYLQEEYSNANSACEASYPPPSTPVPANSAPPVLSGVAAAGKTLSTSTGSWSPTPTGYAYKWQRCASDGTSCGDISGATGTTYTLTSSDAGHEVRSEVSAHDSTGASGYTPSTPTEPVVPLPAASVAPVVSGFAGVGKTLSTTQGTWNTPASYAYQWLRCTTAGISCSSISGATAATYKATSADKGHELEARVFATNAAGTASAVSSPTTVVLGIPGASKLPHIAGKAKVGKHLRVKSGSWIGSPLHFRYQWLRCSAKGRSCVRIKHATRATYRVTKHDVHHRLRVKVIAVNSAGRASSLSSTTRVVKR